MAAGIAALRAARARCRSRAADRRAQLGRLPRQAWRQRHVRVLAVGGRRAVRARPDSGSTASTCTRCRTRRISCSPSATPAGAGAPRSRRSTTACTCSRRPPRPARGCSRSTGPATSPDSASGRRARPTDRSGQSIDNENASRRVEPRPARARGHRGAGDAAAAAGAGRPRAWPRHDRRSGLRRPAPTAAFSRRPRRSRSTERSGLYSLSVPAGSAALVTFPRR